MNHLNLDIVAAHLTAGLFAEYLIKPQPISAANLYFEVLAALQNEAKTFQNNSVLPSQESD